MTNTSSDCPSSYDDGNLTIDFHQQQVYLRGQPVDLSPTEFRLLACLVRNAGQVVPHKTLLTWVWGPEYAGETHYVKLYIRYLRQKIEECPTHRMGDRISFPGATIGECVGVKIKGLYKHLGTHPS
jgi:DNA-binding response OmpR family regulator